ncbi:MAG: hypothetical protein KDI79_16035 [Anaerolineae bacterium]|nr:hypothetical protein [Anaerolineae bacterium]
MKQLTRSQGLKIAAVIVLVLTLIDMVVYELPDLASGMVAVDQAADAVGGPPFFMVILGFAFDVLAIVAAYGTWQAQRWGVILVIMVSAFNCISSAAAAIFAPWVATRIFAAVSLILFLSAIVLCLRREPQAFTQSV